MSLSDFFDRVACITVLVFASASGIWLVGPRLSQWNANSTINELVHRIEQTEDIDVRVRLRQLDGWGIEGLDALVQLASSNRTAVAIEARNIIQEKLTKWQIQLRKSENSNAELALQLSNSLEKYVEKFGVSGSQWIESLALRLIDDSEKLTADATITLLENCERILAAIPAQGRRLRTIPSNFAQSEILDPVTHNPNISIESLAIPSESIIQQQQESIETRSVEFSAESLSNKFMEGPISNWNPEWQTDIEPNGISSTPEQGVNLPGEPTAFPSPVTSKIVQPDEKVASGPARIAVTDVPNPHVIRNYIEQYQNESSELLMRKMPLLDFYQAGAVREVLKERGIDDRELSLIHRLSSEDFNDRLKLVEDFSQLGANQARRWLRELTKDKHPQVRIKALAALSTTNAPEVYDLARNMALSDQDHDVVELATKIIKQLQR